MERLSCHSHQANPHRIGSLVCFVPAGVMPFGVMDLASSLDERRNYGLRRGILAQDTESEACLGIEPARTLSSNA